MNADKTYYEGAKTERSALITKCRKEIRNTIAEPMQQGAYREMLNWLLVRRSRYEIRRSEWGGKRRMRRRNEMHQMSSPLCSIRAA